MKCPQCQIDKPRSEFAGDRHKASGHKSICKECDRYKAKAFYATHRDRRASSDRDRYLRQRAEAVAVYGGRCAWCGSTDRLEFDHVDDDGGRHRRHESHKAMVARIARTGCPIEDYRLRLLCRVCHEWRGSQAALLRRFHVAAIRVFARKGQ